MNSDKFWGEDIHVLYNSNRISEIFPTKDMTRDEKLNAIARLVILIGSTLALYNSNARLLYIPIFTMAFMLFLKRNDTLENFETSCVKPTKNNPFMNVLMSEYTDNPNREPACPPDEEIKESIEESFNFNLYKGLNEDDLFNRNNSQRQFYTNPSTTIPNDQSSFANWLYKSAPTCKENTISCNRNIHEPLQQQKFIFPNSNENPITDS